MDMLPANNNFFEELLVVLVIYKTEINDSPAFVSLTTSLQAAHQKVSIFIYDNSPHTHTHTLSENWTLIYRNDPGNPGVSKAYNEGFNYAKAQNKKWMLLVDQDTEFEKDFFLKCKNAIEVYSSERIFVPIMNDLKGIVSPFAFRFGRGVRLKTIKAGQNRLTKKKFINSGTLIARDLFEQAGGFDERFKLDFSDLIFLDKLISIKKSFLVIDSMCTHSLFSSELKSQQEDLTRFTLYCRAANLFTRQTKDVWVMLWKHTRAMAFFFKYSDWRFITTAFAK